MATLKKYGLERLREWGRLGAEHGKKGGRPPKGERPRIGRGRKNET
jgi:hypothetical protein